MLLSLQFTYLDLQNVQALLTGAANGALDCSAWLEDTGVLLSIGLSVDALFRIGPELGSCLELVASCTPSSLTEDIF